MIRNDVKDLRGDPEKKYKVTIEHPDWEDIKVVFELEKIHTIEEVGIESAACEKIGQFDIKPIWPNGQKRVTIKLWEGCPSFDDFKTKR